MDEKKLEALKPWNELTAEEQIELKEDAHDRIERAAAQLVLRHPWWAAAYLHLDMLEGARQVPTLGVDGRHLYYNPSFVSLLDDEEIIGVLAHETAHCVFQHFERVGERDKQVWNIAADAEINYVLDAAGFTLPPGGVPGQNTGTKKGEPTFNAGQMLAEEIYDILMASAKEMPCGTYGNDMRDGDGNALSDKGATPIDRRELGRYWAEVRSQLQGTEPAEIKRIVGETYEPKEDWRALLARFVSGRRADRERSWSRKNRRIPNWAGQ
ncbi:MAG: hypothetical protein KGI66_04845, partial [Patescibacteria group bacterium]|nr:hypothetical protein [Patescibacteria group bacterium]